MRGTTLAPKRSDHVKVLLEETSGLGGQRGVSRVREKKRGARHRHFENLIKPKGDDEG